MAHFAKLDADNVVLNVLVVNNSDILDENGQESDSAVPGVLCLIGAATGFARQGPSTTDRSGAVTE